MKNIRFLLLLSAAVAGSSCNSTLHSFFGEKTPHEQYVEKLDEKGLDNTPAGRAWQAASQKALENAQDIPLPYFQQGYFSSEKPRALGLRFRGKAGERITIQLTKNAGQPFVLYADVYRSREGGFSHLFAADTSSAIFQMDIEETGPYVLRLQPELFRSAEYQLSISVGPSIGFPLQGAAGAIGSIWGDNRDGGKRRHEGIDIFAPKRTPVVAAADGYITGVTEGGLGGKVIWMKPSDKNVFLYYAHLDKQLVQPGQQVKKGEVLGLVGNTGNAKYTPSHLHFGVYTQNGPVDPLPFVDRKQKIAPAVNPKNLKTSLRLARSKKTDGGKTVNSNTLLTPIGATATGFIAETEDGSTIQVSFRDVKVLPVKTMSVTGKLPRVGRAAPESLHTLT